MRRALPCPFLAPSPISSETDNLEDADKGRRSQETPHGFLVPLARIYVHSNGLFQTRVPSTQRDCSLKYRSRLRSDVLARRVGNSPAWKLILDCGGRRCSGGLSKSYTPVLSSLKTYLLTRHRIFCQHRQRGLSILRFVEPAFVFTREFRKICWYADSNYSEYPDLTNVKESMGDDFLAATTVDKDRYVA